MENGVGQIPFEIAAQQELLWRTFKVLGNASESLPELPIDRTPDGRVRYNLERQSQVVKMKETLDGLVAEGRLKLGTKLFDELHSFVERMLKVRIPESTTKEEDKVKDEKSRDTVDRESTLQVVEEATSGIADTRVLLHLLDVQKSVHGALGEPARCGRTGTKGYYGRDQDPEKSPAFYLKELSDMMKNLRC